MKGKASKIILVVLIILVMLSVFIAGTMIAMPVLKKKDVTIAKDQTDKIKHSYANEDTSSSDSQEITRNYEIKEEETWDVSKNQDGSVMAKWTLSDKTIRISGSGEMKDWNDGEKNDWHRTQYANAIRNVVIEDGVTSIGRYAFEKCSNLESIEIIGKVTGIGNSAFYGCSSLTSIEIPSSVTSIEMYAFSGCSSLTSIEIPSSVTSIGGFAFKGSSLASIEIPSSVTFIGSGVFSSCSSLAEIKVDINNEKYADENGILYDKNKTRLECYPAGKTEKSFAIPSSVESIEWYAFKGCSSLASIEIPSSVTSIGDEAFEGCSSLTSIEIPISVTSIRDWVFFGCSSLTSIEIPSSVTSIGTCAFSDCSSLASIEIPRSVTHVGLTAIPNNTIIYVQADSEGHKYAEEGKYTYVLSGEANNISTNYKIEEEKIWDISKNQDGSVIAKWTLSDKALKISGNGEMKSWKDNNKSEWNENNCVKLIKKITIEDGVNNIGEYAFKGCSSLASIEIPSSVTSIEWYAFKGCSSLASIKILSSVTSIEGGAFYGCSGLASIEIPSSVTSIGLYTFYGCSSLASIEIPSSVTSIEWYAFEGCSSLASIRIPSSITSIGEGAFGRCSSLTEIKVDINNEKYADENGILYDKNKTRLECYPAGKMEKSFAIPSSVTSIEGYAFKGCNSLASIEIPSSVTSIESIAFNGCSSLVSIEIPSSVTSIEWYAFEGCSSLASIKIPSSVTSIEGHAFEGCSSLANIEIPSSVTSIGDRAFTGCSSLASIKIPETVTNIDGKAIPSSTIIYTKVNSEAHKYAEEGEQGYIIDDEAPTVTFDPIGNKNTQKQHSTKITIKDNMVGINEEKLKYQWTQSEETPSQESFTQNFENEQTITKNTGDGNWYLWIYAEDKVGNVTITRSNAFNFDNTPPVTNVEYSTTQPTIENIIATIKSNEPIQEVEGWKLSEDKMTLTKEYENNTTANGEVIEVKDLAGNSAKVTVKIQNIQKEFETDQYKKVNDYIVKIKPNTTYNEFIKNIQTNQTYTVKEGSKIISGTNIIKTGQVLTTQTGKQYTLVVMGDLNGDGKIGIIELARISKIGSGKIKDYKEIEKMAIDANADGKINILDLAVIAKLATGK